MFFSQGRPTSYDVDLALGRIPGHTGVAVVMRNSTTSNTAFTDVWGGGGNIVLPSTAVSLEVSSSDDNDTAAGTGARTVLISTLADTYGVQTPITVELDGQNPVAIPGTHYRPNHLTATSGAFVLTAGSNETNIGDITIRAAGGGDVMMVVTAGTSKSEDGIMVVPLGITALLRQVIINWGKDQSGDVTSSSRPPAADSAIISSGQVNLYQNNLQLIYQTLIRVGEKGEVIYRAQSANLGASVVVIQELEMVDNSVI